VLTGQNLWVTVRFSTRAFTWTHASMFTTRSTTLQTVPTKPRQTVLWWRRVQRKAPPFYIHPKYVRIWLHWSCYLPSLYNEMINMLQRNMDKMHSKSPRFGDCWHEIKQVK